MTVCTSLRVYRFCLHNLLMSLVSSGNMWSQQWNNIYDIAKPFQDLEEVDVTEQMIAQKYNPEHMFKIAEKFFMSIGMDAMPETFWKYSMIEKPEDRDVVCHGSAHNFMKDREVR